MSADGGDDGGGVAEVFTTAGGGRGESSTPALVAPRASPNVRVV